MFTGEMMLKILFSPSEGKIIGGEKQELQLFGAKSARDEILNAYNEIITSQDEEAITSLFGIKKYSDCLPYMVEDIYNAEKLPAIERYSGVAYEYLNYSALDSKAKEYLKENTFIFSNLFGPLTGGDMIPTYKVKQGNTIQGIVPEKFYKERFSYQLDLTLGNSDILDLRAGYYEKFYKCTTPYTTLKFLKGGKTVSHWAKAYRGIVLRELANHQITSLEDFMVLEMESLQVLEIKKIKNKTEIVYGIVEG